jgi:hypothetical protein
MASPTKAKRFFFFFFFFFFFSHFHSFIINTLGENKKQPTYKKSAVPIVNADAILLHAVLAERCWAHAQQLNDEVRNIPTCIHQSIVVSSLRSQKIVLAAESGRPADRLAHHRRQRLSKAVSCAQQLVAQVAAEQSRVSAQTRAECEAYLAAMRGALASAQLRWADSARAYARARNIHAKLRAFPGGRSDAALAVDAALATQLEYAAHRLQRAGGGAAAAASGAVGAADDSNDDAEVDALLESARVAASQQQQAAATALRYKGEPLVLESERVLDALRTALDAESHAMQAAKAAVSSASADDALAAAAAADDALVAAHTTLMNVTREELRRIIGNVAMQSQIEQLALLRRAIGERMQRRTLARLALQYDAAAKAESRIRTIAPLCASATAAAVELGSLAGGDAAPAAGADDAKFDRRAIALAKATATQWRAARAHSLARVRQRAGDFPAAGALLERALALVGDARRELNAALAIAPPAWADAADKAAPTAESGVANAARLDRLQIDIVSVHGAVKAQAFVSGGRATTASGGDAEEIVGADASFESGVARAKAGNLASLRGPVVAIPVKPIMFELAGAGIQFDSLASRTRKQGASGWLGSLFGR